MSIGILMLLAVIIGSVMTLPAPVRQVMLQDKVLHTLAYGLLMGWFAQIYRNDLARLLLAAALVTMGIVIEFVQGSTGHREFEILDMIANTSGVVLAWGLAYTRVGNALAWFESSVCKRVLRT